jgi:hypothetical protein
MIKVVLKAIIIISAVLFFSCDDFRLLSYDEWKDKNGKSNLPPDVYCAGVVGNTPCYWKNGVQTILSTSSSNGYAYSIFIDGSDIYCAGFNQESGVNKATYWKNGERHIVDNSQSLINSISVVNGVVFSAGYLSTLPYIACFWINSERHILPTPGTGNYYAQAISIDKETFDFYIAGRYTKGNIYCCYWKNGGECITIDAGSGFSSADPEGISVVNGKLYIPVYHFTNNGYWNDGNFIFLPGSPQGLNAVNVYDGNIYIAGKVSASAVIWKNQTLIPLQTINGSVGENAYSCIVYNGDIYASGKGFNAVDIACYWKNGVQTTLASGGIASCAYSIAVVPKR